MRTFEMCLSEVYTTLLWAFPVSQRQIHNPNTRKKNRISKFTACSAQLSRLDSKIFFRISLNPT